MENISDRFSAARTLERTRFYLGGYWTFLAMGHETNKEFALIEMNLRRGLEPPRHTHTREDETYFVLEGEIAFTEGDEERILSKGDSVHLPKDVPHHFKLRSETAKVLCHLAPAGLENFFMELSRTADKIDFPPVPAGPPSPEFLQKARELQAKFGIIVIDNSKIVTQ